MIVGMGDMVMSAGATLGLDEVKPAPSTPLFGASPTLALRTTRPNLGDTPECQRYAALVATGNLAAAVAAAPACNASKLTGPVDGCAGFRARVEKYGPLDPIPAIRKALLERCEAYQRSQPSAVSAVSPDEYPAAHGLGGLDTKTKIAIGVGALIVGAIVVKKLQKR